MASHSYCYWTVADRHYSMMYATCIASARAVGVTSDFHAWTDRSIPGAICHPSGHYDFNHYLFKFEFLLKSVRSLAYDYFVFLDADNFFVRDPGDVTRFTGHGPVHVALESDCTREDTIRDEWWGCPLPEYVRLMRENGIVSERIFNTNAGLWIVHREVAERAVELALEFWHRCDQAGYKVTEEPPLAYIGHLLSGNPYEHTIQANPDFWASDWTGHFQDSLPDGQPWEFCHYMGGQSTMVNPAIVHAMRSKDALLDAARPHRLPTT